MEQQLSSYELITDVSDLGRVASTLKDAEFIGVDTETTGLSPWDGRVRPLQLATPEETFVLDTFKVKDISPLKEILEDGPVKVLHNAKFDWSFLKVERGIALSPVFDTMLAAQLLAGGNQSPSFSLEAVAGRYLDDVEMDKTARGEGWSGKLSEAQLEYAARDAAVLLPLRETLARELEQEKLVRVSNIEFKAVAPIAEMELAGIKLDLARWKELEKEIRKRRNQAALDLEKQFPVPDGVLPLEGLPRLNLNSPQQITQAFRTLGIELSDTRVWTLLKVDHPAAKLLLQYRELQKRLGTYLETYPDFVHKKTGRIHANFLQCRVPTGRLACTNPNIQQIPHEDEFRRCFVAEEGNVMVIADYSQIELRILAEVSGDPAFVRAFREGDDLHRVTAASMFGVEKEEITKEQRSAAKRINFGLMYGRGAKSLSAQLGTDDDRARELIAEYFANYPKVQRYLHKTASRALRDGTLRTLSGRIRKFGDTSGLGSVERGSLRREAMNYPIQGASADIAKLALSYIHEELAGLDARLVNCVHDEFVVECAEEAATEVSERVRVAMIRAGEKLLKSVPVEVEVAASREWRK